MALVVLAAAPPGPWRGVCEWRDSTRDCDDDGQSIVLSDDKYYLLKMSQGVEGDLMEAESA